MVINPLFAFVLRPLRRAQRTERSNALQTFKSGSTMTLHGANVRYERARRSIVEAKEVAEFDIGIAMMSVVIFGQNDLQRTSHAHELRRTHPTDLRRMAPPHVKLPEHETEYGTGDRPRSERKERRCDRKVR